MTDDSGTYVSVGFERHRSYAARANPVNGQKPEPAYRRKKKKSKIGLADTEETHRKKCRWCRFRRIFFPWRKPCDSICVPPTEYWPDYFTGYSVDRREWEVVQRNFPGPLNQYYAPEDPDKPEVYMYMVPGETQGLAPVPQYQHQYDDDNLPPYEWARLSTLPTPVVIDDSWSSLFAAQREKARLLDTQSYTSSRITEIDQKVKTIMDAKQERDPDLQMRFTMAQMGGALHAAGLSAIPYFNGQAQASQPTDLAEDDWLRDLDKVFVLRERLSPLSLLSPPPAL